MNKEQELLNEIIDNLDRISSRPYRKEWADIEHAHMRGIAKKSLQDVDKLALYLTIKEAIDIYCSQTDTKRDFAIGTVINYLEGLL